MHKRHFLKPIASIFLGLVLTFFTFSKTVAQEQTVGLFYNDSTSYNGYTLLAPLGSNTTFLIDNCGHEVNRWQSAHKVGLSAYLLENGNLVRPCILDPNSFPGGGSAGRVEMFDWDGNLIWEFNYSNSIVHQHHDIAVLPNGNILILAWEVISSSTAIAAGRIPNLTAPQGIWATQVVEIEPILGSNQGNIVWSWRVWDHIVQNTDPNKPNYGLIGEHPELINVNYAGSSNSSDWLHCNALDYNPVLDQIMLSSRNFDEFWIIDHSTTIEESASHLGGQLGRGGDLAYRWGNPKTYEQGTEADRVFYDQHDAHWIPDSLTDGGKIMVFNNGIARPDGTYSSLDVLDPPLLEDNSYAKEFGLPFAPSNLSWQYVEGPEGDFFSSRLSGGQRLPNGNTLICEGNPGEIFEIDTIGNKVWRYKSPVQGLNIVPQGFNSSGNNVFRAYRYGPNYPAFEGKELLAGDLIEQNPWESDCIIHIDSMVNDTTNTINITENKVEQIQIVTNPIQDELVLDNRHGIPVWVEIHNLQGQRLFFGKKRGQNITFATDTWKKGIYILQLRDASSNQMFTYKVIKL